MKRTVFAALLAGSALSSMSAVAGPVRFTGDLGISAAGNRAYYDDIQDASPIILNGSGNLYVPFSGTKLSATIDLFAERGWDVNEYSPNAPDEYTNYGAGVHLTYSAANRYNLGIVGAVWNAEVLPWDTDPSEDFTYGMIGAEGKFHFDRAAFWAQTGFITPFDAEGTWVDAWADITFVRGGVNYYLEDDLKLAGSLGYFDGTSYDSQYNQTLLQVNVEIEKQFASMWSIYGRFTNNEFDGVYDGDYNISQSMLTMGVRIRLGDNSGGTLASQEATNSIGIPQIHQQQALVDYVY